MATTTEKRLTWKDFPDFVKEVNKFKSMRAKREEAKLALGDINSGFGQEFVNRDRAALNAEIEAKADALLGGTAVMKKVKTRADLEKDLIAAERAMEKQRGVVVLAHVPVAAAIAQHNLQRFRVMITTVRDDVLKFQKDLDALRKLRYDFAIDAGHGEEFAFTGLVGGGLVDAKAMIWPAPICRFVAEESLVHQLRGMVTQFCEPAAEYLRNTENFKEAS
jgi:hypothetical protein